MFFSGRLRICAKWRKRLVRSALLTITGAAHAKLGELLHSVPTFCSTRAGDGGSPKASAALCVIPPQQLLKYALKIRSWPGGPQVTTWPVVASTASRAFAV